MPNANRVLSNYVGGIVSPKMHARIDLPAYQRSVAECRNFITFPEGGARYRNGTVYVSLTRQNKKAVFIPFQFSDQQSYLIEATDLKFRFYKDNGLVLESNKTITGVTNAAPGVFTVTAHGYADGDQVFISTLPGTKRVSNNYYIVDNATTNTFTLTSLFGVALDTTDSGTYTGAGAVARVYEVTTPYKEIDLPYLQYAQSADTMYIVNQEYEPRKLIRSGHADWDLDVYVRSADFISDANDYPRAICFNDSGRLLMAGSKNNPATVWASKAPSHGITDFDDFSDGINATDAIIFTLAAVHGKVDSIQWLTMTSKFLVAGTFSGIRRIYGATVDEPISPTSLTAKSVNTRGCAYTQPVTDGTNLFYIQIGNQAVRSLEYDLQEDGYETIDRNLISSQLSKPGIKQMTQQQGDPYVIWVVRDDGRLLGLTFKEREDISGWHQHFISGSYVNANGVPVYNAKVLWASYMPRPFSDEQLWLVVERNIGGNTVRSVEYVADEIQYPLREDYLSGDSEDAEEEDERRFNNALYEFNKSSVFLDMSLQYDGSDLGTDSLETAFDITGISSANPGVVTAPGHNFIDGDVVYISGVVGTVELNNLYFEVADVAGDTFTLIGQGDDIVLPTKPRGKGKRKKRLEGQQATLVGPVDTSVLTAYDSAGTVAKLGVSLTIYATTGATNIIASGPIFTADMVGREIWKSYDVNGDGGGRAVITRYISELEVESEIRNDGGFDNINDIPPGGWFLTTTSVSGIDHLEGTEVAVTVDGGPHPNATVEDGAIELDRPASVVCCGLGPYRGLIRTMNLDIGGVTGSAQAKKRSIWRVGMRLLNAVGTLIGTSPYRLERIPFNTPMLDRPALPRTAQVVSYYSDVWEEENKSITIVQNQAAPCTVLSIDAFAETADE